MNTRITALDIASWGGFMVFATSSVITAICLPEISNSLAITHAEGGGSETARTILLIVVMLLTGFAVHARGKKYFITLGLYVMASGLLLASFSQSYTMFIASLVIVGIGGGPIEAFINPLVIDIHPKDTEKHLALTNAFYPIGVITSAILFGELLTLGYSWRIMFRIAAAIALTTGLFFNGLRFPAVAASQHSTSQIFARIFRLSGFWLFATAMFLAGGAEAAVTFWSRSYVETYLTDVPRAGTVAVLIFAGMMVVGRLLSAKLSIRIGARTIMAYSAILGIAAGIMLPFARTLGTFYILIALAGVATSCFWPSIFAEAARRLKVDSTILFVLLACFGVTGFGLTPLIMGIIGDYAHLRLSFFIVPVFFILISALLGLNHRSTTS